jgi:hypothetical protein
LAEHLAGDVGQVAIEERGGAGVLVEESHHFVEEGEVIAAGSREEGTMIGGGEVGGFVEEGLNPVQTSAVHACFPGVRSVSATQLESEPGFDGAPVAQNGSFGHFEEGRGLGDIETAEEAALDHDGLAGVEAGEVVEGGIEGEQIPFRGGVLSEGIVEGDEEDLGAATLEGVAAAGGFDEELAHGAGGDAFEVEAGGGGDGGGAGEFQPGFVDEGGGAEGGAGVTAADDGRKAAEFLVGGAEEEVESAALCGRGGEIAAEIVNGNDGFVASFAHSGKNARSQGTAAALAAW